MLHRPPSLVLAQDIILHTIRKCSLSVHLTDVTDVHPHHLFNLRHGWAGVRIRVPASLYEHACLPLSDRLWPLAICDLAPNHQGRLHLAPGPHAR